LADLGRQAVILRTTGVAGGEDGPGIYSADLTDTRAVAAVLARVRQDAGAVGGLVHCLPLADAAGASWDRQARRDTRSLYLLARELEGDLRASGKAARAFLLAATGLGGAFGFAAGALPADYSPGHGGVLGFVKCLYDEWPEVMVRAVDLDATAEPPADVADRLLAELSAEEGPAEVGWQNGRRLTWVPRPAPLVKEGAPAPLVEPGAVVLVTGGARGITAEVALELGRRYRPTLLLVGRSPLPPEEAGDTAGLTTPAPIKAALIARLGLEGRPPAPARVEAAYNRLMQDREVRANLDRLRQTGASVQYHPADVRDEAGFGALLDQLQGKFGPFAGVIHGAGVIEDRLVRDKTPESFDRVFDTKVVGARVLSARLNPDRLRFCVFFASLASRYGNKGQADYAAANEVLSKLALRLDRQWPGRVVSIAWGPWSQVGMVAELEKHLVGRGLRLIAPAEGPDLLLDELVYGKKGESEVILGGGAGALARAGKAAGAEYVA
jgi:NAD(P)-dependent dehydrogenase (short-subunit alcohol dehydrogenase family)